MKIWYAIFKILKESFIIRENIELIVDERFKFIEIFTVLLTIISTQESFLQIIIQGNSKNAEIYILYTRNFFIKKRDLHNLIIEDNSTAVQ